MVAIHMRSCNATDKDLPSACMRTGILPTSVAWIEFLSQRMMSVGKRGMLQSMHMFRSASESIIQSSDRPSELDVGMFAHGMQAFGDGEMVGNNCGTVKMNSAS